MIGEQYELEKLVDYEIRCAKRYRRFISIAMISDRYNSHREEKFIQEHCVRDCDQSIGWKRKRNCHDRN